MSGKPSPALYAVLASALVSALALVLLRLRDTLGMLRGLPITLAELACAFALITSLWAAVIIVKTPRRRPFQRDPSAPLNPTLSTDVHPPPQPVRDEVAKKKPKEKIVYRPDPAAQYRAAVGMAWADGKLDEDEARRLGELELELAVSGGWAEEIEREVMGGTREELVSKDAPKAEPTDEPGVELEGGLEDGQPIDGSEEDGQWIELVEECVGVVKDLDRNMADFDPARRELADHVILSLAEGLQRSGVDLILDDEDFDNKRHESVEVQVRTAPGATITETVSPGIAVGRRVLRKAQVRVG